MLGGGQGWGGGEQEADREPCCVVHIRVFGIRRFGYWLYECLLSVLRCH